jgi:hypothetical protein
MDTLYKFFETKYGDKISSILLNDLQLNANNIKNKNNECQLIVKQHIEKINQDLNLDLNVNATNWAFDFSGWLGQLDLNNDSLKKYMIIGLEPHIERYDYQITYGLSDKSPQNLQRFTLDLNNVFEIQCNDDSSLIWTNLFKLIATEQQKNEVLEQGNVQTMLDFLSQFYITDLCHFAPQDKAKAINNIKNWKKIRQKVASHFLKNEIELIKPKVLITQGNEIFYKLKKILSFDETKSHDLPFGKNCWSVKTGESKDKKYKILSIPHFGSELNYKTFYLKNSALVRNVLINNTLI